MVCPTIGGEGMESRSQATPQSGRHRQRPGFRLRFLHPRQTTSTCAICILAIRLPQTSDCRPKGYHPVELPTDPYHRICGEGQPPYHQAAQSAGCCLESADVQRVSPEQLLPTPGISPGWLASAPLFSSQQLSIFERRPQQQALAGVWSGRCAAFEELWLRETQPFENLRGRRRLPGPRRFRQTRLLRCSESLEEEVLLGRVRPHKRHPLVSLLVQVRQGSRPWQGSG